MSNGVYLAQIAPAGDGNSGQVLTSSGSGVAASWATAAPTGAGTDKIFYLNGQTVTASYSIPNGQNAGTFGSVSINGGVVVTVPSGSTWSIV